MCLLAFAPGTHPAYPLVLAGNRDELHARPAARADWWPHAPEVLGGRDLTAGGSWLGVTRRGRWAAVTNVREPARPQRPDAPSRGVLVAEYLEGDEAPDAYLERIAPIAERWNGFNLLCGDRGEAWWLSNRGPGPVRVTPGVHAVSNAQLDTPWPKVEAIRGELSAALAGPRAGLEEALFAALGRRDPFPDDALPATGVGIEAERALSSAFIDVPGYGTRASTVLLIGSDGEVAFVERAWAPGSALAEVRCSFTLSPPGRAAP